MAHSTLEFFILIDAGDNDVHKIRTQLLTINAIKAVHCLIGPADLICYGQTVDINSLKNHVMSELATLTEEILNPIEHTETLLVLDSCGIDIGTNIPSAPQGHGAWVFADISMPKTFEIQDKLLQRFPEIRSVHSVLGRHDAIFYIEADGIEQLMAVFDDGIRIMRGISATGKPRKTMARTDTRLVQNSY